MSTVLLGSAMDTEMLPATALLMQRTRSCSVLVPLERTEEQSG